MFAIVSVAGKQLQVEEGKEYKVLLSSDQKGQKKVSFPDVLMVSNDGKTNYGTPLLEKANVEAEILKEYLGEKTEVFKFHSKKRYTRTKSQRQQMAQIKILKISYEIKK